MPCFFLVFGSGALGQPSGTGAKNSELNLNYQKAWPALGKVTKVCERLLHRTDLLQEGSVAELR